MKYITLIIGLLVVGCGNSAEKKVIGEYERKTEDGNTRKFALLKNGIVEFFLDGKKTAEAKWSIANGEIHIGDSESIGIYRINTDKSLNFIAIIDDGDRADAPKEVQPTFIKIK